MVQDAEDIVLAHDHVLGSMVTATRMGIFVSAPALTKEERPALTDAAGL